MLCLIDSNGEVVTENEGTAKISLEDILIFATGASKIPPMGFDEQPSVAFNPKREAGGLPSASTCAKRLYLPLYDTSTPSKKRCFLDLAVP